MPLTSARASWGEGALVGLPALPRVRASPRTASRRSPHPPRAIARSMSGFTELSGKIASTRSRRIWSTSRWTSPAEACACVDSDRICADHIHHGHRSQASPSSWVVAILRFAGGTRSTRRRSSRRASRAPARRARRSAGRRARRRDRAQSGARGSHRRRGQRCAGPATSAGRRRAAYRVDQRHHLGISARVVDHVVEPLVDLTAGAEDEVGLGDRGHVAQARLEESCGSPPGRSIPSTETRPPPTWLTRSRRLRCRRDDGPAVAGDEPSPQPAIAKPRSTPRMPSLRTPQSY